MKKYYHYTHFQALTDITESGYIRLATASTYAKKEKAVAWVSSNEHWENTATKMVGTATGETKKLTFDEQVSNFGCARIEVKGAGLQTWGKLKHTAKMDIRMAVSLEKTGKEQGADPNEWFGSLKPIMRKDWLSIEVFNDGAWKKVVIEDEQL